MMANIPAELSRFCNCTKRLRTILADTKRCFEDINEDGRNEVGELKIMKMKVDFQFSPFIISVEEILTALDFQLVTCADPWTLYDILRIGKPKVISGLLQYLEHFLN